MRNVFIGPAEKAPPPKRRRYPFEGAAQPVVPLTVFKTRRIMVEEEVDPIYVTKPNVDFLYGGTPVVVPLRVFLRKSSVKATEDVFPNLSRHVPFNPFFFGGPRLVILGEGPAGGQLGIPTIVGGKQRLQIFIAGVEITNPAVYDFSLVNGLGEAVGSQPLRIVSQTIGRGQATFDLYDPASVLDIELGQTILIQEFGIRYFAGCIATLTVEIINGLVGIIYHVTAVDKAGIFDHRVVLAPFYLAGTDAAEVIRDLFTNPSSLNPPLSLEGITINNVPASLGALSTDLIVNKQYATQVINSVMTDIAGVWWIDTTSDLHAVLLPNIGTAPFSLSLTSNNFRNPACTVTLLDYRNKQYVVSDRVVEPDNGVPGITGIQTVETWTLPQQLANDLGFLPLSVVTNFPMNKVTGLKVNGVAQPVYVGTQLPNINFRHVWWYFPQTNYLIPPNVQNQNIFPDPPEISADPSPGDVVEVSYITPRQSSQVVTNDPLAPLHGTCGSGVYEVVEQVKGITKQSDLNAIAQALLVRSGVIPKQLQFETDVPGLFVGMRLTVDLPPIDLAATTVMITGVDGTALSGNLGNGSRFRWQITATNTQDMGNYINWFERFIARTENAPPLPRLRAYNWVIAPSGSLSDGTVTSTPTSVLDTGQVFKAAVQALNPPTDQTVTFDVISAAQGSILGGPVTLTIPAGSTDLIQITQFTDDPAPFYLYQDDNLTVTATYTVTGPNPVNAANIKLVLQVSF